MFSWASAILAALQALPKVIELLGSIWRSWQQMRETQKEKDIDDKVKKEHDDLRSGVVPRAD